VFDDVLAGNNEFSSKFKDKALTGLAVKGLAIITCIDSRIDPLGLTGMAAGDAKILRNAGARVTDDVLRTLILATHLLGVSRVLVAPHTDCKMATGDENSFHQEIFKKSGVDTRSIEIRTVDNQETTLRQDLLRIKTSPFLPRELVVVGAIYDVKTGKLKEIID
jgi:carbonic anhydrase